MRIRQRPGPLNALGDIKFVFPNNENIYLHHTPSPQLFKRDPEARVNVESLKKLSAFMLDKLQWLEKPVNVDQMVDQSFLPK